MSTEQEHQEVAPVENTGEAAVGTTEAAPKRRGRPRKVKVEEPQAEAGEAAAETPKRKRGRPRKSEAAEASAGGEAPTAEEVDGGNGREDAEPEARGNGARENARRGRWKKNDKGRRRREEEDERISDDMVGVTLHLKEISAMSPTELLELAERYDIENAAGMRKQEQVSAILRAHGLRGGTIYSEGVLEILPDGYGFLRSSDANYLAGPDDVYVSQHQIRRYFLRKGDTVAGEIRPPRRGEKYFALRSVDTVNGEPPEVARTKVLFDNLTPLYPEERLRMEVDDPTYKDITGRVIDLVAPIGKGQRGLLVAPPRTGKTVM
ncbi:MAG: Rho termination factor N-terminal domain-containing protein, partial [Mariprofundaceae bacterium]